MRYLSVCSGIGSDHLAAPSSWNCVGFAEVDPFARAVLSHRFQGVPLHGDFTKLDAAEIGTVDALVGGTPCQSFSVAGQRAGIDDPRGNLSLEFVQLARRIGARWIVWENVPGVLSSGSGRDFGRFLSALEDCGYSVAWRVLDAQWFGVPQRRRRVYVVASSRADVGAVASVLFEREGGEWHPSARRTQGKDVAGTLGRGTSNSGGDSDTDRMTLLPDTIGTITTSFGPKNYSNHQDVVSGSIIPDRIVGPLLRSTGLGYNKDDHIAYTLDADAGAGRGYKQPIAFDAWDNRDSVSGDTTDPVRGGGRVAVASETVVRRLTPLECERLQGLPDHWTAVPFRKQAVAADQNRYRAIGNGWAVPVVRWLFDRLDRVDRGEVVP